MGIPRGVYTAKPNLPGVESVYLFLGFTITSMEAVMPEFIGSPIFLIIAAVLALFIIIGIFKHTARFLIWIAVIQVPEIREWFERLPKW